jgi:hypothetical protein
MKDQSAVSELGRGANHIIPRCSRIGAISDRRIGLFIHGNLCMALHAQVRSLYEAETALVSTLLYYHSLFRRCNLRA